MYSLLHRHLKVCDGRSALLHSAPQRFGILAGERNMSNLDVIKEPSFVEPRRYNVSGSSGCRSGNPDQQRRARLPSCPPSASNIVKVRGLGVRGACSVHVHGGDRTVPAWKGDGLRPARFCCSCDESFAAGICPGTG